MRPVKHKRALYALTRRVLVARGNPTSDTAAVRKIFGAIYPTLRRRDGATVQAQRETKPARWSISEEKPALGYLLREHDATDERGNGEEDEGEHWGY